MALKLINPLFRNLRNLASQRPTTRMFSLTPGRLHNLSGNTHKVNNLEKKFLVWTGKFKTVEEIPSYLPPEMVERARSRMRIRLANLMMALTLVACLVVSFSGKRAFERGETVQQKSMDWHKQLKEQAEKEKKE